MDSSKSDATDIGILASHFEVILAAMVEGLVVINSRGRIECFNSAAEGIFGYAAQEVLGQNVNVLMPSPYADEHDHYLERYSATREGRILGLGREVAGRRKDGSLFPMQLSVGAFENAGTSHFVGVVRDLSERKAFEENLANREAQLHLIFDQAPVGSFTVNPRGLIQRCNSAFEALLGRSEASLIGTPHEAIIHTDDRTSLHECFANLFSRTSVEPRCVHEVRYVRYSGQVAHTILHAGLVDSATGDPVVIGQVIDQSERIEVEEELRQLRDRLAHGNRVSVMGEMASGIAHEINQPLTAISAYAQACRRLQEQGLGNDPAFADALDQIALQAQRAGEVIRRLRGFVRREESSKCSLQLDEVLVGVTKLADVDARTHEVSIERDIESDLPPVLGDAIQVQQVVLNLLRNAMEAMSEPGNGSVSSRTVVLHAWLEDDRVWIAVLDRGTGLNSEVARQLFTPFYTTKSGGLGLGLAICQSIVNAHGGVLEYLPREGGGSVFRFSLPIAPGALHAHG